MDIIWISKAQNVVIQTSEIGMNDNIEGGTIRPIPSSLMRGTINPIFSLQTPFLSDEHQVAT